METIEQLKQDNAKLTERLNNAAKFFREQKAQIEQLTNENKQLKDQIDSLQFNEECDSDVINNYSKEAIELKETIESKDKAYKVLQNTYNELFEENKKLKEDLENYIKQIRATEKTYDEEQKKIISARDQWMSMYKELELKIKEFDISKSEAETKLETIQKEYKQKFEVQEEQINNLNIQLSETKEHYDNLNILYDNCENEKLSIEADYLTLKESFENLKLQADINKEFAERYKEIFEELEKYKEFINRLFTQAESFVVTWKKPEDIQQPNEKKKKQNKEGRILNQEMNVQGMTINI